MSGTYNFLPFQFKPFGSDFLLVNDVGEHYFLKKKQFHNFVNKNLDCASNGFLDLTSKHMAYTDQLPHTIDLLATAYRTKKKYLYDFTSLHMFVITHRCNQKCHYCHASSEGYDEVQEYDMDIVTARKCVDLALKSPSKHLKFEFQGGEPLLNFDIVKEIVEYSQTTIQHTNKKVDYVICSNLIPVTQEHLSFFIDNHICVSTSLDGPERIHDQCRRTRKDQGTYKEVVKSIEWVAKKLGIDQISALMTTTQHSIENLEEVVDEYVKLGFQSIFLRMINPHGFAIDEWGNIGYSVDDFISAYENALKYIIQLNLNGHFFVEEYACLLLTKILTPFSTGFVDLQSPSGAGIGGIIYEINGDVYIADEGRMLAKRTGDKIFKVGNSHIDSFDSIFCGRKLFNFAKLSTIEAIPGCAWCVYQAYCGSDPVRNYIEHNNFGIAQSKTQFCKKHKAIFDILFNYIKDNDQDTLDVFWSWITRRSLSETKIDKGQSN